MNDWSAMSLQFGKLLLAAVLGGIIGFERESHGQAAGFRTYLVVSTGACLMMLLSLQIEAIYHSFDVSHSVVRLDPGRIASYAIAGMGFLGSGAIIKGKGSVRGLTTAAGLWIATGIGLSIGAGLIYQTLFATCVILVALYWVHPIRKLTPHRLYSMVTVKFAQEEDALVKLRSVLDEFPSVVVQNYSYEFEVASQVATYRIRIYSTSDKDWSEVVNRFLLIKTVKWVSWTESDVP
ncbi:MAG: MgtC/SapB family protein [Nitrospirae bacterium]|uniref:MgtC/SapB family protein n=1 Tax=Candidatus Magnetobacterium casense TaxID=1455061 RepID=UPI00058FA98F|nr:MgtC/SapB family protein [Candidatus Magnetobacterium casensis]MBF0339244.1 MgtC/SapB family protein [Nitrospirota bacterium]